MTFYILDERGEPKRATVRQWMAWMQTGPDRVVARTGSTIIVSTVFLAGTGPGEMLYETKVFNGSLDPDIVRYRTRAEALAGHARWVKAVDLAEGGDGWRSKPED